MRKELRKFANKNHDRASSDEKDIFILMEKCRQNEKDEGTKQGSRITERQFMARWLGS